MSKTPFMPLWIADFLGDTLELDGEEIGAYLLILMAMWQRGGTLPNDPMTLKRVCRVSRGWPKVWAALERYFKAQDGMITNARLNFELQKVDAKRAVNAQSGERGGRANALKNKKSRLANASVSLKQPEPQPESERKESESIPPPPLETPEPEKAGGGGSQPTSDEIFGDREAILQAIGADLITGKLPGQATRLGTPADMLEVKRWLEIPDLTLPLICQQIAADMADRPGTVPNSFRYFTPSLKRLAGRIAADPLTATAPEAGSGRRANGGYDRRSNSRAVGAMAAALSDGTARLDPHNPFGADGPGDDEVIIGGLIVKKNSAYFAYRTAPKNEGLRLVNGDPPGETVDHQPGAGTGLRLVNGHDRTGGTHD